MKFVTTPACTRSRLGIAAALLLLLSATATAQPTGSIKGMVVDANGSPLSGVVVTVTGPGFREERVTGADGSYAAAGLAAGEYLVTAVLPGFETLELPASVEADRTETVRIVMQIERLLETVSIVAEEPRIFARNVVAEPMMLQQSTITSVASVVDNLPGVSIQEGDAYGFDDWSSSVAVRGFQVTISEAQIGTTIDGFLNGTSDYFSGARANRFIDPMNLGGVEVSQGTADIASRSVEALGGTFDYLTDASAAERTYTASSTIGENEGQRFSVRVDTGPLFGDGETRAWIAAVRQESTDWVQGSARNEREHVAAKLVSSRGRLDLTSYLSYDSIHEDTYQRLYSEADFRANPRWDRLVGDWPGVPYRRSASSGTSSPTYWYQYEWGLPQHVKWYVEETLYAGPVTLSGGVKQFLVGVSREDLFVVDPALDVDSDSDLLLSGGVTYETVRDAGRGTRPLRRLCGELQGDQQHAARGAGPQPRPARARDRFERRRRAAVCRGSGRIERHLVHHRLPEPDLLPRPANAGRSQLPHPGRRGLLQCGRHRHERRRGLRDGADAAPDVVLHRVHLQRLEVPRHRRSADRREPGHRGGDRCDRRAGPALGRLARSQWSARRGSDRQVHLAASRQPEVGLVRGHLLAGGRLRQLLGRGAERAAAVDGVLDRGEQPVGQGLSICLPSPRTPRGSARRGRPR